MLDVRASGVAAYGLRMGPGNYSCGKLGAALVCPRVVWALFEDSA